MNKISTLFQRKRTVLRLAFIAAFAVTVSFVPCVFMQSAGLYINLTGSMERGIWKESGICCAEPPRGSAVVVNGEALSLDTRLLQSKLLLKRVSALEGDSVSYSAAEKRVYINGKPLPNSEIFLKGKGGIPLPHPAYPYVVPKGYVYLSSEHVYGYDSRYFGPVPSDAIFAVVMPLVCW